MGSRVELFAAIRRDARVEECSIRELAERYHVHRRTVRQALAGAIPPARKSPARTSPRLEPFKAAIDVMLGPEQWERIAASIRGTAAASGRGIRIYVDLTGPKLRTRAREAGP